MSNLVVTPFLFDNLTIRTMNISGEPWFVGRDVAEALGYKDTTNAIKQHCKGVVKHHPLQTIPLLPAYATNAPRAMNGKLLSGTGISARKFNQLAFEAGFLVSKERFSTTSPSGTKAFWSISESGSEFGYNLTNPKNERETQPYWYEDKFADLLSLMLPPDAMQSATAK